MDHPPDQSSGRYFSLDSRATNGSGQRRSRWERWHTDGWLDEVLVISFSVLLDVALCGVLKYYDGRPLPMFGTLLNSGVTLNTVVSLLATFSVAASILVVEESLGQLKWLWCAQHTRPLTDLATYDKASRGALGSAQLLWKLRLRPLPSAGALLLVAHLAIAPLTQQSVLTTLTSVPAPPGSATAAAPRATRWNTTGGTESYTMPGGYNRINATMKGAVLNGLFFHSDALADVPPTCTSGNCTFAPYHSLAVCASVADVSDRLVATVVRPGSQSDALATWCLPGGHCLNATGAYPTVAWVRSAAGPHAGDNWQPGEHLTMLNYTSTAFAARRAAVADIYLIYRNTTNAAYRNTDRVRPVEDLQYSALELVLDWCVPTFETTVQNGVAATTRAPDVFRDFVVPDNLDKVTGSLQPVHAVLNGSAYEVDQFTHDTLQRYLWVLLSGDIDTPGRGSALDGKSEAFMNLTFTSSDAAQAVWAATQVAGTDRWDDGLHQLPSAAHAVAAAQRMLSNTATSMSNLIRKQSQQPAHVGTATVAQNIVTIEWGYVVVLAGFTAASLLFLVVVMLVGGRPAHHIGERPPVLKSSTFALVRCLDPALHPATGGMRRESRMAEDAAAIRVQLVADADGSWRLIPTDSRPTSLNGTVHISRPFRSASSDMDIKRNAMNSHDRLI